VDEETVSEEESAGCEDAEVPSVFLDSLVDNGGEVAAGEEDDEAAGADED